MGGVATVILGTGSHQNLAVRLAVVARVVINSDNKLTDFKK